MVTIQVEQLENAKKYRSNILSACRDEISKRGLVLKAYFFQNKSFVELMV